MEEQQPEGAYRDAAVCEIKDRGEEDNLLPASYYGEVEHIHHLAEHKGSVVPYKAVEKTVDNVSERARGNERKAQQDPVRGAAGSP